MRLFFLTLVTLSEMGWSAACFAYIPPSQYILKTWANKHTAMKRVRIKTLVTAYEGNKPTDLHFKELSEYLPETEVLKSWVSDDSGKVLSYLEKKTDEFSPVSRLFLRSLNWQQLSLDLKDAGIPIRTEEELLSLRTEQDRMNSENQSLQRWNGTFAWVMGSASSQDVTSPQIWFEKDTFLPLRMIFSEKQIGKQPRRQNDVLTEVRFDNYRSYRGFPYPRNATLLRDGNIYCTSQLIELMTEGEKTHSGEAAPDNTVPESSLSSPMRELIRAYYAQFR